MARKTSRTRRDNSSVPSLICGIKTKDKMARRKKGDFWGKEGIDKERERKAGQFEEVRMAKVHCLHVRNVR